MITMASIIDRFGVDYLQQHKGSILPSHVHALNAMKQCRSSSGPGMLVQCASCDDQRIVPHSCGHRSCPHCQNFESQQWIDRQSQLLVPGTYFMVTFTVPAELRALARKNQKSVYALIMQCAWETLRAFAKEHKQLQGEAGAVGVLHTHARNLDFHPHVHMVMPAAAFDEDKKLWRRLEPSATGGYLFNEKALAKMFRGKLLDGLRKAGLTLPRDMPKKWVVHCKSVGDGSKALVYLGRYLYRGVIQEKDILSCKDGQVTYRWIDSGTKREMRRTVSGANFLRMVLQHVLPKGFRRSRNYGFLHPNSKRLIARLKLMVFRAPPTPPQPRPPWLCTCCGGLMLVLKRKIRGQAGASPPNPWSQKTKAGDG